MDLERRMKYMNGSKTINKSGVKININFDAYTLGIMASYVVSENRTIKRGQLTNLRNLISMLDIDLYKSDVTRMELLKFISRALEAKLEKDLKDPVIIEKYINGGVVEDNNNKPVKISDLKVLSGSEIKWVTETVSESLKYSFVYNDVEVLYDILTRFRATDYVDRGAIVKELEEEIVRLNNLFRKAKANQSDEITFSLESGVFEDCMKEIHNDLTNPSSRLYTGMQGFNKLIGGAFETGRVYMLLGLAGAGKSLSLLNIAKQLKTNNTHFKPKDPTKKPVIVILTMENTVKETVGRLFEMATGEDISKVSAEEAIRLFKEEGELYLSDQNPINIIIKFMPNRSVDTSYLYSMAEDLEEEGYEMVCLIQDHVKRIRSIEKGTDLRIELGNIVNEFKTFAMLKDCVVITNSHLNREAAKTIDDGTRGNKADLIRMIGRANISESMLMIDNLDVGIVITQEYDQDGNKYMGFKRIKERIKCDPNLNIVYQMFKNPESLAFVEDKNMRVPLYKDTLRPDVNTIQATTVIDDDRYQIYEDKNDMLDSFNIFNYKNNDASNNVNTNTNKYASVINSYIGNSRNNKKIHYIN